MGLYIKDKGRLKKWSLGEPFPEIEGERIEFTADGKELELILFIVKYPYKYPVNDVLEQVAYIIYVKSQQKGLGAQAPLWNQLSPTEIHYWIGEARRMMNNYNQLYGSANNEEKK